MSKMDVANSKKFLMFSKDEQDVIKAGIDLYKHFLFLNKDDKRYAEYSQGKSYEEKQSLFTKSLMTEAFKRAGVPQSFNDATMMQNPNVKWSMFALISETLNVIIPATVLDQFGQFAEVRNVGWGDNLKFNIPNPNLFVVSKIANGVRKGEPQRLYNSELVLTPLPHDITIQEDFYRVLAGQVNFGDWITRIAQSVETAISTDVYNAFYNSYANLPAAFKEAAFATTPFINLAQRVETMNRGAKVAVFGTRVALSKIQPNANFSNYGVGVGEEFIRMGYIGQFASINTFLLEQRMKPNDPSYGFAVADDALYFVSVGTDKPVKIGFEGQPVIYQSQMGQNADNTIDYGYQQLWDAQVVSSAKFGIMKV